MLTAAETSLPSVSNSVIMSAKAHSEPGPFNTNGFLLKSQFYSQFLIETWANGLIPPSLSLHITDRGIT